MLTTQQAAAIKAHILASPDLDALPNTADGAFAIADLLNLPASPNHFIWAPESTTVNTIMSNGFVWTFVNSLGVGKARIWEWMKDTGTINGGQPNVRAGILEAFAGGPAEPTAMRLAVLGHLQRSAKRIEKLFATGAGTTTTDQAVGPATTTWTRGNIGYQDVYEARNS